MPIINIATTSGVVRNASSDYNTTITATSGDTVYVYPSSARIGQREHLGSYEIRRGFMAFDVTGITVAPTSSVTVNLYVTMGSGASYYIQDSTAPDLTTNIAVGDFDAYGPNGSYTSLITITGDGWISIPLDSFAIADINSNSIFKLLLLGDGDYTDTAPGSETEELDIFDFSANVPYISYVESVIYPNWIRGRHPWTVSEMNGVLATSISKINLLDVVVAPSVSFSPSYPNIGYSGGLSGVVNIVGVSASFYASTIVYGSGNITTNITVGSGSKTAVSTTGTVNSTSFTLAPGTYSYYLSVTISSGSGEGSIGYTQ